MKNYIGTKQILAKPMTRGEYNQLRGWLVPQDENPRDDGYLVVYPDSPDRNVEGFNGYVSWSPKAEFEKAYRTENFTFGQALELVKQGKCITRTGWNSKGMFVLLIKGHAVAESINACYGDGNNEVNVPVRDALYLYTTANDLVAWVASQNDMLAEDWQIV